MAHELEIINGQASMFYVGKTPWHGLGRELQNPPTIKEAIEAAGLNWAVSLHEVFYQGANGIMLQAPGRAVVRDTDGKALSVVGDRYKPLQNADAFNFFQPFLDQGVVDLHTAGSLKEGRKIWVLAKVKNGTADVVAGDPIEAYILLANSHDGSTAISVGFTPIRVVCHNTLTSAMNAGTSKLIRIYHTAQATDLLTQVQNTMNVLQGTFSANVEQFKALAGKALNSADVEKYIRCVFKIDAEKPVAELHHTQQALIETVSQLHEIGQGSQLAGVRGTAWGAFNAVTEYLSHVAGRSADNRLNSLWFGQNQQVLDRALSEGLKLVA